MRYLIVFLCLLISSTSARSYPRSKNSSRPERSRARPTTSLHKYHERIRRKLRKRPRRKKSIVRKKNIRSNPRLSRSMRRKTLNKKHLNRRKFSRDNRKRPTRRQINHRNNKLLKDEYLEEKAQKKNVLLNQGENDELKATN